jgi:hypothetical protein
MTYCIVNSEPVANGAPILFWSNVDGWVTWGTHTRFTKLEKNDLYLPSGGDWAPDHIMNMLFYSTPPNVRKGIFDL